MGSLSNYAETAVSGHLNTNAAYTPAATLYLALATADPTDAGTGASMNECANTGSYARTAIAFGAAASRRVTQSGAVNFPTASGGWGTVSHWAILDSATHGAGNVLAYGAFGTPKSVVSGNSPTVATAEIYVEITASTGLSNYAANGMLDRMFRNQAFTVSANYLALVTVVVTDSMTGSTITEPSGNNYSRKEIDNVGGVSPNWEAVVAGAFQNEDAFNNAVPSGSWGTIVGMAMCNASTTGEVLWYDNSLTDQLVSLNDTVSWAAGAIDFAQT